MFARADSFPSPTEAGGVMVGRGLGLLALAVAVSSLTSSPGCHLGPLSVP